MRMCCGCNQRFEQRQLIRLQVSPTTQALIPVKKKIAGRSAWVCVDFTCMNKITRHPKRLQRSLRTQPKMDAFLDTVHSWLHTNAQSMLSSIVRDGALFFSTRPLNLTFSYGDSHTLPSEVLEYIRQSTIEINQTPNNESHTLQMYEHHLLQRTILCIDVLIKLKLDSFR